MARAKKPPAPERHRDDGPPALLPVPVTTVGNGTYVRCDACGGARMPGGPHAATFVTNPPAGWPVCAHGMAHMSDCKSRPVAPPCCRGGV